MIRSRIRPKINKHNPLVPLKTNEHIRLEPGRVREALKAYEEWDGKDSVPSKLKDLMMVLSIELTFELTSKRQE